MDIQQLRKQLKQQRHIFSHVALTSTVINQSLCKQTIFHTSQHIACYLSYNNEVNTQAIIATIWQQGKICHLPVVNQQTMQFVRYHPTSTLKINRLGIYEPIEYDEVVTPEQLDLVITPLVGFNQLGYRLGTGAGYYDRYFSFLNNIKRPSKPYLLGLAYEFQKIASLPKQPWDVALDCVITEQNIYVP